jgi:hypothetical protein
MNPISLDDLYRAKAARRAQLAALPLDEKVRLMEKLQDMGHTLRAARQQLFKGERSIMAEVAANLM